jgi:hypothetical protein
MLPMLRRQAGEPFAVLLRCHLKPPTRGTLTTALSHFQRLESR